MELYTLRQDLLKIMETLQENIDDLEAGHREIKVTGEEGSKDPLEFCIMENQRKKDEIAWDSPWGEGRPGWHIECSEMSRNISEIQLIFMQVEKT